MPKRRIKRYKMRQPDKIRLSRQLDAQLSRRQEQLAREETMPGFVADEEKKERSIHVANWSYPVRVALFFLLLIIGAVAVWVAPHPTHSEIEQRELAKFPAFTVKTFFSGEYFDDINTWFADTFPARETWVKLDGWSNQFYRISNQKLYGTVEQGDEIPDAPTRPTEDVHATTAAMSATSSTTATAPTSTKTSKGTTTTASNTSTGVTTTTKPTAKTTRAVSERDYFNDNAAENAPTQTLGGVLVRGDSAYEYYNFSKSTGDAYVAAVNKAAAKLKGAAKVYDIVVPTSIDVMLPQSVRDDLNSSDQKKATEYLYGSMSADVVTVPIIDVLRSHNAEYLYFHSDHHWTARGAYYAYAEFAKKAGLTPHAIGEYSTREFDGFRGTFFSDTQDAKLRMDTVIAYEPLGDGSLYFIDRDGSRLDWQIITNVTDWDARVKYNTFIGGDNPYTEITSGMIHDGSAAVVVKESFGNAFVPFLVDHFEKVYVLDYRYYTDMSLADFTRAKGAKTVVFINNMSATRNAGLVEDIAALVG